MGSAYVPKLDPGPEQRAHPLPPPRLIFFQAVFVVVVNFDCITHIYFYCSQYNMHFILYYHYKNIGYTTYLKEYQNNPQTSRILPRRWDIGNQPFNKCISILIVLSNRNKWTHYHEKWIIDLKKYFPAFVPRRVFRNIDTYSAFSFNLLVSKTFYKIF